MKDLLNKITASFLMVSFLSMLFISPVAAQDEGYYRIINKSPDNNYIFLFVIRSAAFLDWSSPSALAKTNINSIVVKNFQSSELSTIGHAQVGWHCNDGQGNIFTGATGQSGQENGQGFDAVVSGWGLSVLDMLFPDGYLETEESVLKRTQAADKYNNFAWVGFRVDNKSCLEMVNFIREYDQRNAAEYYGFPVEPTKFEGAGCTSFANATLSFIDQRIKSLSESWIRHVRLPEEFMGKMMAAPAMSKPLELAKSPDEEKKVSLLDYIMRANSWAGEGEPYKDFYYYDPELFYESLVHLENYYRQQSGMRLKEAARTPIYDQFQEFSKLNSEKWLEQIMKNNKRVKVDKIYSTTGLIIDL